MNPFPIEIALKSALILAIASGLAFTFRRASAAARHLIWITALAGTLVLPCLSIVAPAWTSAPKANGPAPVSVTPSLPAAVTVPPLAPPRGQPIPWQPVMLGLWAAGVLAVIGRLIAGTIRTRQMAGPAFRIERPGLLPELLQRLHISRPVRVLEMTDGSMPMTWGLFRPTVLLPNDAHQWRADRVRMVLSHELVHVQRFDYLTHIISQIACAVYWPNPLVWFAAGQLRKERERACDDGVLRLGEQPSGYAEQLLDLARTLGAVQPAWSSSIAMASPSDLESRLIALLDNRRNRNTVSRRATLLTAIAAACILVPLAALKSPAQAAKGTISGTVYDISGAAVPDASVTASNLDTHTRETGRTNDAGEYRFAFIPTGRYEIEVKKPGFAIFRQTTLELTQGVDLRFDPKLQLGAVNETVDVLGTSRSRQLPRSAPATGDARRIRIGGSVQATKLVSQVKPVYPETAQQQGIEGTVLLRAVIATGGSLLSVGVMNTLANPDLAAAAMDAIKQWRYQPTLLNGMPVEVETTISVNFRLQK